MPALAPRGPRAPSPPRPASGRYGPSAPAAGRRPRPPSGTPSRGLEEAAGFAGQAARRTLRATEAYLTVLGCELRAPVRALGTHAVRPAAAAFTVADGALPDGTDDRPLTGDVTAAAGPLPPLAQW